MRQDPFAFYGRERKFQGVLLDQPLATTRITPPPVSGSQQLPHSRPLLQNSYPLIRHLLAVPLLPAHSGCSSEQREGSFVTLDLENEFKNRDD